MKATVGIYVVLCQLLELIAFLAFNKALASCTVVEGLPFLRAVAKNRSWLRMPATLALHRLNGLFLRALVAIIGVF